MGSGPNDEPFALSASTSFAGLIWRFERTPPVTVSVASSGGLVVGPSEALKCTVPAALPVVTRPQSPIVVPVVSGSSTLHSTWAVTSIHSYGEAELWASARTQVV